jgi:uncharacterized membrane protein YesL
MLRDPRLALAKFTPTTDEPPSWLRRTLSLLWDNVATLVLLNLVGSLVATPLLLLGMAFGFVTLLVAATITVVPILGGLMAAVSGEWRHRPGTMRQHFLSAIRHRWLALLPLGLLAAACAGSSVLTTSQVMTTPEQGLLLLWLAQCSFLIIAVMLLLYAVPLVAGHGLGPRLALRNALILTIAAPVPTLGIFALLVLSTILMVWFGLGLWLILPVVVAVFAATNCEHQIEQLPRMPDQ